MTAASSPAPVTALERWAPLPPLVLVNTVAVYGQYGWAAANLPPVTIDGRAFPLWAFLFAAALESIAIYLSYEAHKARMAGDSSAKLWAAAYAVAGLAGALNYWHLADPVTHQPTPAAVAFGVMSLLSPWLWRIRSRSMNRDRLRDLDLIEPRAVKFSAARWALFPRETFAAFKAAVWIGETNPLAAVGLLEPPTAEEKPGDYERKGGERKPNLPLMNATDRKVLEALTAGALGMSDLHRAAELPLSTTKVSVARLLERGLVVKDGTRYKRQAAA